MKRRLPAKRQAGSFKRGVLAVSVAGLFGLGALVWLTYRVTHPGPLAEAVTPAHYLLPSVDVSWSGKDGKEIPGWWIPGLKGAPGILLAPGYSMTRGDGLSLAAQLREQGFNVLIYEARGSTRPRHVSTLGIQEADDMMSALDFLQTRRDSSNNRIGIWGVDVSARAALHAAASRPSVRAVVADSPFERVADFLAIRVAEESGIENRFLAIGCGLLLQLAWFVPSTALISGPPLDALADRPILFVQGENRKALARYTAAIYDRIQPQKELVTVHSSRSRRMSPDELRSYDRQVSNFFALNLPRGGPGAN
jgi:hypothetical protein